MPKAAPPNRFNWKLVLAVLAGFLLFVALFESTAMASRSVESMLLANERFFLEANSMTGAGFMASAGTPADSSGIRVEGNHYASRERIVLVFAPDFNKSIFHIPLAERRRRLLAVDWIEDASVQRIWPNQLIVKVRERRPVAFAKLPLGVSGKFRYLLIDAQGVLLSVPHRRFDFPVLTGVPEDQAETERRTRVLSDATVVALQLGPAATGMISEINVASPQDVRVSAKINGHNLELWLGDRNYLAAGSRTSTIILTEILRQADGTSGV